jgi:bacterioferritin
MSVNRFMTDSFAVVHHNSTGRENSPVQNRKCCASRFANPDGIAFARKKGFQHPNSTMESPMPEKQASRTLTPPDGTAGTNNAKQLSREQLVKLLNEDLAREYQAIIAYTVYSQVLKGPEYMNIAGELEKHAHEELAHALLIARQIDYLGGSPTVTAKPVKTSEDPKQMLRFDLNNENETIRNYRERVRQCEALGEYAIAEHIRQILVDEQEHQIDLATALGEDVVDVTAPEERA